MTGFLPREVLEGLHLAQKKARKSSTRLCLHIGDEIIRVRRAWEGGFALSAEDGEILPGLVDLYDGSKHLARCLIVASSIEGDERQFEYKVMTEALDKQPVDFVRAEAAPVALLPLA